MIYTVLSSHDLRRALASAIDQSQQDPDARTAGITIRVELPDGGIAQIEPFQVSEEGDGHIGIYCHQLDVENRISGQAQAEIGGIGAGAGGNDGADPAGSATPSEAMTASGMPYRMRQRVRRLEAAIEILDEAVMRFAVATAETASDDDLRDERPPLPPG